MEVATGERTFVQRGDVAADIEKRLQQLGPLTAAFPQPPPR